ncbi:retinoschisin-like [Nematostella vectensis]|uniref:retinoschisin-like n=1 Tax=Nematostella vectensis TaxID=45351 RepID=UPI0020775DA0|nr:retinoschisin-like [Nematostella vectensis]
MIMNNFSDILPFAVDVDTAMNFFSKRIFSFETLCALLAVLLVILVGNNLISGQQCDAGDPELPFDTREPMKGIKLSGMAPWRTVLVQDLLHCAELCKKRRSCTVYNVGPLDTTGLVRPCELYDGPVLVKEDQTTNNPDWYLGGRQCDVGSGCTNGEECIQFGSRKSPENKCIPGCVFNQYPLGMEDGRIPDSSITASSSWNSGLSPHYGRLNNQLVRGQHSGAWAARNLRTGEYLQVDLGRVMWVTHVATQGRPQGSSQWVTEYSVEYSLTGDQWQSYQDENGVIKVFPGNSDKTTVVKHEFFPVIKARFVRIVVRAWQEHITMRAEFYGCEA